LTQKGATVLRRTEAPFDAGALGWVQTREKAMAKILVVDDDAAVRTTLEQILEDAGYDVITARDGVRGMSAFSNLQPDVIVMDIVMPEQNGIETIVEMRKAAPDAKIIAISGGGRIGNIDVLRIAKHLGAVSVIAKPFDPSELLDCVAACLGAGNPPAAPSDETPR
jgi:CheY-like chemotaxis protein